MHLVNQNLSGPFTFDVGEGIYNYDKKYLHINFNDKFQKKKFKEKLNLAKRLNNSWIYLNNSIDSKYIYNIGNKIFNNDVEHNDLSFEVKAIGLVYGKEEEVKFSKNKKYRFYSCQFSSLLNTGDMMREFYKSMISETLFKYPNFDFKFESRDIKYEVSISFTTYNEVTETITPYWYFEFTGIESFDEISFIKSKLQAVIDFISRRRDTSVDMIEIHDDSKKSFNSRYASIYFQNDNIIESKEIWSKGLSLFNLLDYLPDIFQSIFKDEINLTLFNRYYEKTTPFDLINTLSSFDDMFYLLKKKKKLEPSCHLNKKVKRGKVETTLLEHFGQEIYMNEFETLIKNIPLMSIKDKLIFILSRYENYLLDDGMLRFSTFIFSRYKWNVDDISSRLTKSRHTVAHGKHKKEIPIYAFYDAYLIQICFYLMYFESIDIPYFRTIYLIEMIFEGHSQICKR